jgi:hypothetical protein
LIPSEGTICLVVQQFKSPFDGKSLIRRFTEARVDIEKKGKRKVKYFESIKTTFCNGTKLKNVTHFTIITDDVFAIPFEDIKFKSELPFYKGLSRKVK